MPTPLKFRVRFVRASIWRCALRGYVNLEETEGKPECETFRLFANDAECDNAGFRFCRVKRTKQEIL